MSLTTRGCLLLAIGISDWGRDGSYDKMNKERQGLVDSGGVGQGTVGLGSPVGNNHLTKVDAARERIGASKMHTCASCNLPFPEPLMSTLDPPKCKCCVTRDFIKETQERAGNQ